MVDMTNANTDVNPNSDTAEVSLVDFDSILTVLNEQTVDGNKDVSFYVSVAVSSVWSSAVYKSYFSYKALESEDNSPEFIEEKEQAINDAKSIFTWLFRDCNYEPVGENALKVIFEEIDEPIEFDILLAEELIDNHLEYRMYGAHDDLTLDEAQAVYEKISNDIDPELVRSALFLMLDEDSPCNPDSRDYKACAQSCIDAAGAINEVTDAQVRHALFETFGDEAHDIDVDSEQYKDALHELKSVNVAFTKNVIKDLDTDLVDIGDEHELFLAHIMQIRPQADLRELVNNSMAYEKELQHSARTKTDLAVTSIESGRLNFDSEPRGNYLYYRTVKLMESIERSMNKSKVAYRKARNNRRSSSFKRGNLLARYEGLKEAFAKAQRVLNKAEDADKSNTSDELSRQMENSTGTFERQNTDMPAGWKEPDDFNGGMQSMT